MEMLLYCKTYKLVENKQLLCNILQYALRKLCTGLNSLNFFVVSQYMPFHVYKKYK